MAADQRQGLDHRLARAAAGLELQCLQQPDQPAPVVPGVGGPQRGLHGAPVRRARGLVLGDQVAQRLLARHRVDHGADGVVRASDRGLGQPEQQRLLPGDLAELADQFLGDFPLGAGADPVHGRDQQVRQGIGDLPPPLVHQRSQQGQHQRPGMVAQVRRGFHRGAGPPGGDHLRRNAGEHAVRQACRTHRVQLADLGEHRLQAHVAGHRLDQRQRRRLRAVGVVIVGGRGQDGQAGAGVRAEPPGHLRRQRLLGLVQSRADDPVAAARGRRLDLLRAALGQQFLPHPVGPPFGLADAGGQPLGELAGVLGGALPEPQVAADLRPVVFDRAARPLVESEIGGRHADLAGDERDRVVIQLGPAAREPARPGVELQQQREPQPGRPALHGDQLPLVLQQGPVVDQLVQVHQHHHAFPRSAADDSEGH